ncbi:MAG: BlaI/MecI/CopY family transcriptional regulator [Verrucomicrobiales bacterium]|nr:BlaI/MecI/CopY family transcriptional regulator [Verrucomicrobiales bacterium]
MKKLPKPTESELSILRILWEHGPCGVRVVAGELSRERQKEVGYTTALKLLQLMHAKGLVERDETERSHRYSAKHPPETMQRHVVAEVADRIFGGSTTRLAMQALSSRQASPDELTQLKQLIEELEQKKGKK